MVANTCFAASVNRPAASPHLGEQCNIFLSLLYSLQASAYNSERNYKLNLSKTHISTVPSIFHHVWCLNWLPGLRLVFNAITWGF